MINCEQISWSREDERTSSLLEYSVILGRARAMDAKYQAQTFAVLVECGQTVDSCCDSRRWGLRPLIALLFGTYERGRLSGKKFYSWYRRVGRLSFAGACLIYPGMSTKTSSSCETFLQSLRPRRKTSPFTIGLSPNAIASLVLPIPNPLPYLPKRKTSFLGVLCVRDSCGGPCHSRV
jgi:hypothetical protein